MSIPMVFDPGGGCIGLTITARSAAVQPSVVSTPSGDERCALKGLARPFTVPAPTLGRGNRSMVVTAMVAIAEAFQDALAMRRAAQRNHFLGKNDGEGGRLLAVRHFRN